MNSATIAKPNTDSSNGMRAVAGSQRLDRGAENRLHNTIAPAGRRECQRDRHYAASDARPVCERGQGGHLQKERQDQLDARSIEEPSSRLGVSVARPCAGASLLAHSDTRAVSRRDAPARRYEQWSVHAACQRRSPESHRRWTLSVAAVESREWGKGPPSGFGTRFSSDRRRDAATVPEPTDRMHKWGQGALRERSRSPSSCLGCSRPARIASRQNR